VRKKNTSTRKQSRKTAQKGRRKKTSKGPVLKKGVIQEGKRAGRKVKSVVLSEGERRISAKNVCTGLSEKGTGSEREAP